jgi:hypothetical protein
MVPLFLSLHERPNFYLERKKTNGQPQAASVGAAYSAAFPARQRCLGAILNGFAAAVTGS